MWHPGHQSWRSGPLLPYPATDRGGISSYICRIGTAVGCVAGNHPALGSDEILMGFSQFRDASTSLRQSRQTSLSVFISMDPRCASMGAKAGNSVHWASVTCTSEAIGRLKKSSKICWHSLGMRVTDQILCFQLRVF